MSNIKEIVVENKVINDCEMISNGAFSPIKGFMNKEETQNVLNNMELLSGDLWSIPIVLPLDENQAKNIVSGEVLILKDSNNTEIAKIIVEETFTLDKLDYCEKVYGTSDLKHPGVKSFMDSGETFISGPITMINKPSRDGIDEKYYLDPKDTKRIFKEKGWNTVVAFQTRNPIHRAHEYIQKCALEFVDGLLIHPIVGDTKKDDIPADVRMDCYEVLVENYYSKENTMLSVMPAAMRYAGPKEAILHAIIRQNYGCTHFIVGRDHAGVGDYYGTYEAQEMLLSVQDKLKIHILPFEHAFYCQKCENVTSQKTCPHDKSYYIHLSGTQVRELLKSGQRPPLEFTREKVADVLIKWATKSN